MHINPRSQDVYMFNKKNEMYVTNKVEMYVHLKAILLQHLPFSYFCIIILGISSNFFIWEIWLSNNGLKILSWHPYVQLFTKMFCNFWMG